MMRMWPTADKPIPKSVCGGCGKYIRFAAGLRRVKAVRYYRCAGRLSLITIVYSIPWLDR